MRKRAFGSAREPRGCVQQTLWTWSHSLDVELNVIAPKTLSYFINFNSHRSLLSKKKRLEASATCASKLHDFASIRCRLLPETLKVVITHKDQWLKMVKTLQALKPKLPGSKTCCLFLSVWILCWGLQVDASVAEDPEKSLDVRRCGECSEQTSLVSKKQWKVLVLKSRSGSGCCRQKAWWCLENWSFHFPHLQ